MNGLIGSLALLPLERALNHLLTEDPHLVSRLAGFQGRCLRINGRVPACAVTVFFDAGRIRLSSVAPETSGAPADLTISGRSADLLRLLLQEPRRRQLADPTIDISGDGVLAQDLYQVLQTLDLDWTDWLAPLAGDVLTHSAAGVVTGLHEWSRDAHGNLRRNVADYLTEESRLTLPRRHLERFENRLDQLKLRIDRVEARARELVRDDAQQAR